MNFPFHCNEFSLQEFFSLRWNHCLLTCIVDRGREGSKSQKMGDIIYGQLDTILGFKVGALSILKELNIEYITTYLLFIRFSKTVTQWIYKTQFFPGIVSSPWNRRRKRRRSVGGKYLSLFLNSLQYFLNYFWK